MRAICRVVDPESSKGLVTDVCLKRKIRNFVEISSENEAGYEIYVKEKSVLNLQNKRAYEALGIESEAKKLPKEEAKARDITAWMCKNFFDIRTFGAVMTTEVNSGQVRGPVQLVFCPIHRPDCAAGSFHHPYGGNQRKRLGKRTHHGAQIHCPLRALPRAWLYLRQPCR